MLADEVGYCIVTLKRDLFFRSFPRNFRENAAPLILEYLVDRLVGDELIIIDLWMLSNSPVIIFIFNHLGAF
jgi:hypothetical protein